MKKIAATIVAIFTLLLCTVAQDFFYVYYHNGTTQRYPAEKADSISLIPPVITVSPVYKSFDGTGGTFDVTVTTKEAWTASSTQTWSTLSVTSGSGDGTVTVTVAKNTTITADVAIITFTTPTNKVATITINRAANPNYVTDICGNTYPVVTIGTQTWMAENLKCNKYDTQSEAYNASWLTNNSISTSSSAVYTPYFTDATDKTKWNSTMYAGNLSNEQISKSGYLYNWAAAVGVENGQTYGTTPFSGNRQGICPNGWHVPTKYEWETLGNYIDGNKGQIDAGTKLKTTSGWYSNGSGTDTYGFSALPAGSAGGYKVYDVGYQIFFSNSSDADYDVCLLYNKDNLIYKEGSEQNHYGASVRCLKDEETISVTPTTKDIDYAGGTFDVTVTSNASWTASSNQTWATLSTTSGSEDATITITVASNASATADVATITLTTSGGKTATVTINRAGDPTKVTDICGNTYPTVTIGTQTWMAENLKCNKYDTESEAYNASWLSDNTISTSSSAVYTPYYTDATDKTLWSTTTYAGNLSNEQISKLGYLYNWAAAVGVSDGSEVSSLSGFQGICPNGWHIPSKTEIDALIEYMGGKVEGLSKIKSKSGWYNNQNGTDDFGFSLLPAGSVLGSQNPGDTGPGCIGYHACIHTYTSSEVAIISAYYGEISVDKDVVETVEFKKNYGRSVRCIKN